MRNNIHSIHSITPLDLRQFDGAANPNVTADAGLSDEMKTFYSDYLIDLAEPELVHEQFGQRLPIPQGQGKTIQFRRFDPLPEATTALTEGVTPDGQSLSVSAVTATVAQYGGYVTLSDLLLLTAVDNNLMQATKLIASQAGRTLDTLTREVLNAGTVVQYAAGQVASRAALYYTSADDNCNLTVDAVKKAVRFLETQNAPKINGFYVGIIHPCCKYDLMRDPAWRNPHEYVDTEHLYRNEIGELYGVRFVQSSRAKVFRAAPLSAGSKCLTVRTAISESTTSVAVKEKLTAEDAAALAGRKVMLGDSEVTVASATAGDAGSAALTLSAAVSAVAADTLIWPEGAGRNGADVYSTLILADDAYGVTEVSGGGLKHIVKQLGSAGTGDALDQRATCGWKATRAAELLVPQYLVRVETTASA